jgi:hypothetical protein
LMTWRAQKSWIQPPISIRTEQEKQKICHHLPPGNRQPSDAVKKITQKIR